MRDRKLLSGDKQMSTSNSQNGNSQISNWQTSPRWHGITRPYTPHDVNRLRGSFQIEHTLARHGAERLWNLLHDEAESYVPALGAMTGDQIGHAEGNNGVEWLAPLIADAEGGFGGRRAAFGLMKAMIEAGAACVHF